MAIAIVIQTAQKIAAKNPNFAAQAEALVRKYKSKLRAHKTYILAHAVDLPEIAN